MVKAKYNLRENAVPDRSYCSFVSTLGIFLLFLLFILLLVIFCSYETKGKTVEEQNAIALEKEYSPDNIENIFKESRVSPYEGIIKKNSIEGYFISSNNNDYEDSGEYVTESIYRNYFPVYPDFGNDETDTSDDDDYPSSFEDMRTNLFSSFIFQTTTSKNTDDLNLNQDEDTAPPIATITPIILDKSENIADFLNSINKFTTLKAVTENDFVSDSTEALDYNKTYQQNEDYSTDVYYSSNVPNDIIAPGTIVETTTAVLQEFKQAPTLSEMTSEQITNNSKNIEEEVSTSEYDFGSTASSEYDEEEEMFMTSDDDSGTNEWIFRTIISETATVSVDELLEMESSESNTVIPTLKSSKHPANVTENKESINRGDNQTTAEYHTINVTEEIAASNNSVTSSDYIDKKTRMKTSQQYLDPRTVSKRTDHKKWATSELRFPTVAAKSLSFMSHFSDPCEDFYEFSCGNFGDVRESVRYENLEATLNALNADRNPPDYLAYFKDFLSSCRKYEFDEEDMNLISEENSDKNITEFLASSILLQSNSLFSVDIGIDKDSYGISQFVLQLHPPSFTSGTHRLNDWSLFEKTRKTCLTEQIDAVSNQEVNLNSVYLSFNRCQKSKWDKFNNSIVRILSDQSINHNYRLEYINRKYSVKSISQLSSWCPLIDWKNLFQLITHKKIQDHHTVQIYSLDYFDKLFKEVCNGFNATQDLKTTLEILNNLQLYYNLNEYKIDREMYCMDLTKSLMPEVSNILYYKNENEIELTKKYNKIENLFYKLKLQFNSSLREGNITEKYGAFRVKMPNIKLVFLDISTDIEDLKNVSSEKYQKYKNVKDMSYPTKLLWLIKNRSKTFYSLFDENVSEFILASYFVTPSDDLPTTFYHTKSIIVPPGVFKNRPIYMPNFILASMIGIHLARELARHFDPVGRNIEIEETADIKNLYKFLTTEMTERSMRTNYTRNFSGKKLSYAIKGDLSANERINDNTAFKLVYDYFSATKDANDELPWISDTYSMEQIFFISVAQEYCQRTTTLDFLKDIFESARLPAPLRVENIVQNSKEFASKVFNCADGTEMNPPNEKIQFPFISRQLIPDDYSYAYENMNDVYNK